MQIQDQIRVDFDLLTQSGMEKFTEHVHYRIQKEFLEKGRLSNPKAFILTQIDPTTERLSDEWHVVVVATDRFDNAGKNRFAHHVKTSCKKFNARAVMFASEAWGTDRTAPSKDQLLLGALSYLWMRLGNSLENFPGRQELVLFQREVRGEKPKMWQAMINQIADRKILGDFQFIDATGSEGRLTNFLEQ